MKATVFIFSNLFFLLSYSQVVYTDISDTTISLGTTLDSIDYNVDMNGDQIIDFTINLWGTDTSGYISLKDNAYSGSSNLNGALEDGIYQALNLSLGDTINVNSTIWNPLIGDLIMVVYGPIHYGTFSGGIVDGFLGFKFSIGTALHYGWLRLDVSGNKSQILVKDFAYESNAGTLITAGKGMVGIDKSKLIESAIIYPNPSFDGKFNIKLPIAGNYAVKVRNLLGQELYSFSKKSASIIAFQIPNPTPGLFLVTIKGETMVSSYRLVIK